MPFEGNHKADVAPGENEFDTPGLYVQIQQFTYFLGLFINLVFSQFILEISLRHVH